jgi:lycopene cyclase domain-containing protein
MAHLTYLALLAGCIAVSVLLEFSLRTRVYARWRRLIAAVAPVTVVFTSWDLLAVHDHQWSFDRRWISGWWIAPGLPIEELVFFIAVPICAISTFEAVRRCRPNWRVGRDRGSRQ